MELVFVINPLRLGKLVVLSGLRYFAKRNETLRNGTLRNGTLRNGTLRNGTLRNGTLRNGTLRNGYTSANAPEFLVGDQILKISSLESFITPYL